MNMKYIFLLLILFFISCSKNEESIANDNFIKLSSYSVRFLAGDECLIDVHSNTGDLSLVEENPKIATGWWTNNGKSIKIKGESVGITSIYVKDRYDPDVLSKIDIVSGYFEGYYKEIESDAITVIQVDDNVIQKEIEFELKVLAKARIGTLYSFSKNTKTVIIREPQGKSYNGSYDWNIDSITIKTNETTQKYLFRQVDDGLIEIGLDLAEIYKRKYPNISIYHIMSYILLSKDLMTTNVRNF